MHFKFNTQVTAHDIDTNCLATPTSTVKYMMEAVDRNMLCCKPSYQELMNKGLSFIVSRTAIEVLRPLQEYENISVETLATPSKNVSFPRSYIIKVGEEIVAKGLAIWALVDTREHKLVRGSDFSVEGYGTDEAIELGISNRFRLSKEIDLTKCGEKKIMYSDIDRNFHMNNTKYFDIQIFRVLDSLSVKAYSLSIKYFESGIVLE
jgi:acyl-ACP thioesterase